MNACIWHVYVYVVGVLLGGSRKFWLEGILELYI